MLHGIKDNLQRFQYAANAESQVRRSRLLRENRSFTIVANDCWGAEVYKDFGLPFETPFIGLFVAGPCYITLVENFRRIVTSPATLYQSIKVSNSNGDAGEKEKPNWALRRRTWRYTFFTTKRRPKPHPSGIDVLERINWDRLFFKISADSQFPFTDDELRRFDSLPTSRKFIFTTRSLPDVKCAITTPDYLKDGKLMYERTHRYVDMAAWLK